MAIVPVISLDQAVARVKGARDAALWASPSVRAMAGAAFDLAAADLGEPPVVPGGCDLLVAVGGGTLLDRAKWAAKGQERKIDLIAVPSIWGSGAEASKVVVLDDHGRKTIHVHDDLLPDARVVWPDLAASVPDSLAADACGDAWSHALEGFWSPLASDALREELSTLMRSMLTLPIGSDARWFEPSARACAGQAGSSVGLIHGLAHALEAPLRAAQPRAGWGHARLCALMLRPVMAFNLATSDKPGVLLARHELDAQALGAVFDRLYDSDRARAALPVLKEHWKAVLRDPCTRTNVALVRPAALEYFEKALGS